ncbi:MAG: DUF5309 family protein [Pseudomonadales bacterium]|jgi:hypothetical protein|nr:DUF5309 family protein [Pseudomonadales bacterium]
MPQPANAFDRYDLATAGDTVREDFTDMIYDISPTETPFINNCGRGTASATSKEWQIDALADAVDNGFHIDGDDFAGDALDDPERIGNYLGILRKDIVVTRRANKVNTAGFRKALAFQIAKKGKELKRDMEATLLANNAALAGDSTTPPQFAGVPAWLKTNTSRGGTGADPALSNTTYGFPTTAATDGTDRALDESIISGLYEDIYIAGGNPKVLMAGPRAKAKFSRYMFGSDARVATPYQDHGANKKNGLTVVGAVDVYVGDYGVYELVPNRFQREDDFFILDMDYWSVDYLDGMITQEIAKSGDSEKRMLLVDFTLCSKNEAASGVFADVDETLDMVA